MMSILLWLALSVLGGYTAYEQSASRQSAAESLAASLARNVAISSANLILTNSLDGLEELAVRSVELANTREVLVLDRQGASMSQVIRHDDGAVRVMYDTQAGVPLPSVPADASAPAVQVLDDVIEAWHPVVAGGVVGWVRVRQDARDLAAERIRIWRNTLVISALAIGACVVVLSALLRRPLRALAHARDFAREMVDAKGRQWPAEPGPAEFLELRDSLNEASMLMHQQMLLLEHQMSGLVAHEAQLAEQNDQLGAIFRLSQDGLVTFDQKGSVRFVNQAFLDHTGLSPEQVHRCDVQGLSDLLGQAVKDGRPFTGLEGVFRDDGQVEPDPLVLELAGDRRKVLSLSGQRSEQGNVSRVLYVCDVTRQQQLDEMKSEFLSMAAHELRTPMVSIYGFTELMLKREMPADQRADLLGRIYRQSQSMVSILNELLDLARIEARRGQDFKIEPLDFAELVVSVVKDYRPPEGRVPPVLSPAPSTLMVRADCHKLQQAVLNILSNAYKYSPDGGDVRVSFVEHVDAHGQVRQGVCIEDQGIGLSADHVARLGERFFRADKSGNIPGTGLGVSIVKELMELMGGGMEVRSQLGQGTAVTLWL